MRRKRCFCFRDQFAVCLGSMLAKLANVAKARYTHLLVALWALPAVLLLAAFPMLLSNKSGAGVPSRNEIERHTSSLKIVRKLFSRFRTHRHFWLCVVWF